MSDINTGNLTGTTGATSGTRRSEQAKQLIGQAGETLKSEAQSFASVAQDRVRAEAQKGTQAATKTLGDFANAVRRAGDELAGADQSPASRLVRQAADGLESLSRNLADKEPGDLLNAVRDFGRRNPAAFIGGAVLVGVALGRFARASEPDTSLRRIGEEDMAFMAQETPEGVGARSGLAAPLADDLDGLQGSDPTITASATGDTLADLAPHEDGTTGVLGDDAPESAVGANPTPYTGGR